MKARLVKEVRLRNERFGGVCYVPSRDDFYFATPEVFALIRSLSDRWTAVRPANQGAYRTLAQLGITETAEPRVAERPYSGPSFLGRFDDVPAVEEALVVNCFCTAHCPLRCIYCYADDLMRGSFRTGESDESIGKVAATALAVKSLVAVVTGGDPLTRPDRARRLIEALSQERAVVVDTSGVGNLDALMPTLLSAGVHMRISLDAISEKNDKLRPLNVAYASSNAAPSRHQAGDAIRRCLTAGLSVTVQTVVCTHNDDLSELRDLRDYIAMLGVRNWVIHIVVMAGKALELDRSAKRKRRGGIRPSPSLYSRLRLLVQECEEAGLSVDLRVTDGGERPNSVLLVGSEGDLFTEGQAQKGKLLLCRAGAIRDNAMLSPHFDRFGHSQRYLNWHPWLYPEGSVLGDLCIALP